MATTLLFIAPGEAGLHGTGQGGAWGRGAVVSLLKSSKRWAGGDNRTFSYIPYEKFIWLGLVDNE